MPDLKKPETVAFYERNPQIVASSKSKCTVASLNQDNAAARYQSSIVSGSNTKTHQQSLITKPFLTTRGSFLNYDSTTTIKRQTQNLVTEKAVALESYTQIAGKSLATLGGGDNSK